MLASAKFLISFAVTSVTVIVAMTTVLYANAELYTTRLGAREQLKSNGIYGRSIWDDFFAYKFTLYEMRPTEFISVGSSRAMPVRALLFRNEDHLSFGGAVNSVAEFSAFVERLRAMPRRPAVAFVYVDFDWFLESASRMRNNSNWQSYDNWLFVYQSAFVHIEDLIQGAFAKKFVVDPIAGGALVGSRAARFADGFRIDGSTQQYSFEKGLRPWPDGDISSFIQEPASSAAQEDAQKYSIRRNWWGAKINKESFQQFEASLKSLQIGGTSVVLLAAPIATHLATAMEHNPALKFFPIWLNRLEAIARGRQIPFFDFTHLPLKNATCFTDRYHASEGAYAWMLSQISKRLNESGHPGGRVFDSARLEKASDPNCIRSLGPAKAR